MTKQSRAILKTKQHDFLNQEIWILTFGGAFQRAGIYKKDYPEKTRTAFRQTLRYEVEKLVKEKYNNQVFPDQHITNINALVKFSESTKIKGEPIPINFGVAQKLLNLYLKYLWCLDKIPEPPHFPVDRMIQEKLNKVVRHKDNKHLNILPIKVEPWTQFEDNEQYDKIIELAKQIRNNINKFKDMSLAQLELELFSRR